MPRRSQTADPKAVSRSLAELFTEFPYLLEGADIGDQIGELVRAHHLLRDLGSTLGASLADDDAGSGRARILAYLRAQVGKVVHTDELMIVAGIGDYPRRIRELRTEHGWPIISGATVKDMRGDEDGGQAAVDLPATMLPEEYVLLEDRQDREAKKRWETANRIRNDNGSVQAKILLYLRTNVGRRVTSEELRYVAGDKSEWARRVRELRTEDGWPVVTRYSGDPTLPPGIYVLAADEQAPPHDRHIKELVRRDVMIRDDWSCRWTGCGWSKDRADKDARFLEVHHIERHADGGSNEASNLVTLCNLHHDEVHRSGRLDLESSTRSSLGLS